MLVISSRQKFDILRVVSLLAKHDLDTSVSEKEIFIKNGIIPFDVLQELFKIIPKFVVRNYSQETAKGTADLTSSESTQNHTVKYPITDEGDVFFCDFGVPHDHEIGYQRPAIVLWDFNKKVLVLPCTSNPNYFDGKFEISFKRENFKKLDKYSNLTDSMGLINQLRVVDKSRLVSKVGTLTDEALQQIIVTIQSYFMFRTTNITLDQFSILKMVNKDTICEIVKSTDTDVTKINRILTLYGFNLTSNGVSYLRDFILYALDLDNFNINILGEKVAQNNPSIPVQEIERLTNARFKEVFGKKYKRIEFIRLIKLLLKG